MSAVPPSKLARLIAQQEGFGLTGALPTRSNNPGDLEHAPGEVHDTDSPVGSFATAQAGWDALQRQLELYASRGMTVQQAVYTFAPPSENNSAAYLKYVCDGLGCTPDTLVSEVLEAPS